VFREAAAKATVERGSGPSPSFFDVRVRLLIFTSQYAHNDPGDYSPYGIVVKFGHTDGWPLCLATAGTGEC